MKKLLILACIAIMPHIAFSQFSLSGTVKDAETGEKMAGAHVIIEDTYQFAVTGNQGGFMIKNLREGNYRLKITFMGYQPFKKEVMLNGDKSLSIEMQPQAILEDEVVISATRASVKSPTTFQNVTKKEIEGVNLGKDLPILLETTPSAVITSDAGAGIGYTGLRIRGTDITRINVTVNGIPLNDPESQGVFWVNMPDFATSIDNIQVQRGVGTSTNGAAAFGASINIQTQKLKAEPYAEINSSAGSYRTLRNNVSFGTGLLDGKFAIDGRLSKITSDGYIDRGSSDLKSFFVSGGYYGENSILKLNVFSGKEKTYQSWYGIPADSLITNRTYNPAGEYVDEQGNLVYYDNQTDNYQQDHYQLHFSQALGRKLNLNAALFYVHGFGYYESYKSDESFEDYGLNNVIIGGDTILETDLISRKYLDNDFYGVTFSSNYNDFSRLQVSVGGSWNYYDGDHYGTVIWAQYAGNGSIDRHWYDNTGIKRQFNVFGKVNYQLLKPLNVYGDLQVRGIHYEIDGIHDDLRDISQEHDFTFLNPKAGFVYEFDQQHQAYASVAVAGREPTRSDYRDADEDHQPRAEQLIDYEAGYYFRSGDISAKANFYYMDYKDQLVLTGEINNVGAPIFTNVPKSYRTGIELLLGWKAAGWLNWEGNATFSRNKIANFTEFVDDLTPPYEQVSKSLGETDLAFSPEVIANSIITVFPAESLRISFLSRYVGKQYIDNTSSDERAIDPYFVNDLRIGYDLKTGWFKKVSLYLNVNNVFSEEYETNAWVYRYYYEGREYLMNGYFPQAPVNFLAGISLEL
ncbi:MAG: TonB-dependent receptor [Bacteroidales bacterium]